MEPGALPPLQFQFGVNWAGAEFGSKILPGKENREYVWPTAASLDYYRSKGVGLIRLPFLWERIQPELMKPLDPTYLSEMVRSVKLIEERGMKVIPDLHSYMRYHKQLVGSDEVPYAALGDVWRRLAEVFKDSPAIYGYGLMNEPYNTEGHYLKAYQVAIDGVRAVDSKNAIVVGGESWSSAQRWPKENKDIHKILKDPSNNLIWEGHAYFDHNASGLYKNTYDEEISRPNPRVNPNLAIERIQPFVEWLRENNQRGLLGEFSVPDNDPRWLVILDNACRYMAENQLPCTYWAAGTFWGKTPYAIEPRDGKDRPQIGVLLKYTPKLAE